MSWQIGVIIGTGRKEKKQVVVGLLCDEWGYPITIEVFTGNTRDFNAFGSQVKKVARGVGCERVAFVGDRGMIKSGQIEELKDADFSYITATAKPQIDKLLKTGIFQMELFDKEVCEVQHEEVRYILRRNPESVEKIACIRKEKKETIEKLCQKKNIYLFGHLRAKVKTAVNEVNSRIKRLKIAGWLSVEVNGRVLVTTQVDRLKAFRNFVMTKSRYSSLSLPIFSLISFSLTYLSSYK
ncbi:hypothetical protein M1N10_00260 [Thermodesulfovibrionales bacterium]|nr:hypothetical protein [Thermodesulfovibrionales bacterium]